MLPFYPYLANQPQNGASNASLAQQQVNGNSSNVMQNFVPLQGQSQAGFNPNPQNYAPFQTPNPISGNENQGSVQNDHLGNSHMGSAPSMPPLAHGGFGPQNLNPLAGFNGNLGNLLAQNLLLANGSMNGLNPNTGLMNAQLALQNQLQGINQLLMALTNPSQLGAFNPQGMIPQNGAFPGNPHSNPSQQQMGYSMGSCGNQVAQGVIPQNGGFPGNPQPGLMQPNGGGQQVNRLQQNTFPMRVNGNALNQFSAPNQQMQTNSLPPSSSGSSLPHNSQSMGSQGTQGNRDMMNISTANHGQSNTFNRDYKGGPSSWRDKCQKPQSQYLNKMNGKKKISNGSSEKGSIRDNGTEVVHNSGNNSKSIRSRSLVALYSEKEIQQWREARKKYYPTKANVEKKQLHNSKRSGDVEKEAELRRQQLKNVLAKQVELGIEVPEIPPHYLLDAEGKQLGNDERKRPFNQNDRFQNRFNKRGRFDHKDQYKPRGPVDKRGRFDHKDPSKARGPDNEHLASKRQRQDANNMGWKSRSRPREPTLLEKLLTTDVKRDRCHALQAFRFMAMNLFFEDDSKPLKFPKVIVKETSSELEGDLPLEEAGSEVANLAKIEELDASVDASDDETAKYEVEEGEVTD